jgi:hypothetical protein
LPANCRLIESLFEQQHLRRLRRLRCDLGLLLRQRILLSRVLAKLGSQREPLEISC